MRVRTILFYFFSCLVALPFLLLLPLLILPRPVTLWVTNLYLRIQLVLLRAFCGITYVIEGIEHLPSGACLIAAQHESSWETLYFQYLLGHPVMYAKKEIFRYPVFGFLATKVGHIPIDRGGAIESVRDGFKNGASAVKNGRKLLIFPSGTRSNGGQAKVQSGVGVLYQLAGVPVVPVLLNSGQCWPKGTLWKCPGTIRVRLLPAIAPGMDRRAFLTKISKELETKI